MNQSWPILTNGRGQERESRNQKKHRAVRFRAILSPNEISNQIREDELDRVDLLRDDDCPGALLQ